MFVRMPLIWFVGIQGEGERKITERRWVPWWSGIQRENVRSEEEWSRERNGKNEKERQGISNPVISLLGISNPVI